FQSLCHAASGFAPIEGLMRSISFHRPQIRSFDFLIRGKAIFAVETFAPTADARTIPRLTGIDDLVITRPALGATHSIKRLNNTQLIVSSMLLNAKSVQKSSEIIRSMTFVFAPTH